MANQSPNKPRIPNGTRVQWRARYDFDPLNEGVVKAFCPKGTKDHRYGWNFEFDIYIVEVDRTPSGKPRKTPKVMRPYASRLEAQNPDALKG